MSFSSPELRAWSWLAWGASTGQEVTAAVLGRVICYSLGMLSALYNPQQCL